MKKVLLGSTALIAAGLLAGPVMAQSAAPGKQPQPLRLGLGGYFQAYGVYVNQPDSPGEYGVDRRQFDDPPRLINNGNLPNRVIMHQPDKISARNVLRCRDRLRLVQKR